MVRGWDFFKLGSGPVADQERPTSPPASWQPPLFDWSATGKARGAVALVPALDAASTLSVARYWYRRHLEQHGHTRNTIESYSYDLALFEAHTGPRPVAAIAPRDVAAFLGESDKPVTRKRRLTSLGGFFKYLVTAAKVLPMDPSAGFYPDYIPLSTPRPLHAAEQARLLAAAEAESARTHTAIWLLLRLGLTRGELIALRREHVDLADSERPVVYIYYEQPRWAGKERHLAAAAEFGLLYQRFLEECEPEGLLFPLVPQSVNKLVERVAAAANLGHHVKPRQLRDTFAVERARGGADEVELLALLGLADDPRNRTSVARYLKLAAAPL